MPFPDYTLAECDAAIAELDAKIAKLRPLADRASLGGGRYFDHAQTMSRLRLERGEWIARRAVAETGTTSPLQDADVALW